MITAGNYEGQAVKGKVQFGEAAGGGLQLAIDMELFDAQSKSLGEMTTFLYFTEGAAPYSYDRLRLLGWKGKGADDIDKLDDIFTNRVPCRVTAPEPYMDAAGIKKMGTAKLEIMAGAGTVTISKPLDVNTFKARLRALGGGGGSGQAPAGGGTAPPF